LSEAVRVGHATVVAHLLSAGAEPDAKGGHQRGPLALAIAYQRPDCVSLLLDAGASVDDGMRRGARATENGEVVGLVEDAVADRERAERLAGRNNADGAQERFDFGVKP